MGKRDETLKASRPDRGRPERFAGSGLYGFLGKGTYLDTWREAANFEGDNATHNFLRTVLIALKQR
jgi:hypothetical protein